MHKLLAICGGLVGSMAAGVSAAQAQVPVSLDEVPPKAAAFAPFDASAAAREAAAVAKAQKNDQGASLTEASAADLQRNALRRCAVFESQAAQQACVYRIQNSPAAGSIEGGGVLRTHIQTLPRP